MRTTRIFLLTTRDWVGPPVLDVEVVDCALDLLISGAPGVVHYEHQEDGGFAHYGGFVRIGADRRGLSTAAEVDLGCAIGPLELIRLKPADYFMGCKQKPDPWDRFACLAHWTQETLGEECAETYDCGSF